LAPAGPPCKPNVAYSLLSPSRRSTLFHRGRGHAAGGGKKPRV